MLTVSLVAALSIPGITGKSVGGWAWCNDRVCDAGEGDCDRDSGATCVDGWCPSSQCSTGWCHLNVGADYGFRPKVDVCESRSSCEGNTCELYEGETVSVNSHQVSINFIGSSSVKLNIDGEITNTLEEGISQRMDDGSLVTILDIETQDYAGGIKKVEFRLEGGSGGGNNPFENCIYADYLDYQIVPRPNLKEVCTNELNGSIPSMYYLEITKNLYANNLCASGTDIFDMKNTGNMLYEEEEHGDLLLGYEWVTTCNHNNNASAGFSYDSRTIVRGVICC